eukprot:6209614-Pleurochrysis_carterae.AAC.1
MASRPRSPAQSQKRGAPPAGVGLAGRESLITSVKSLLALTNVLASGELLVLADADAGAADAANVAAAVACSAPACLPGTRLSSRSHIAAHKRGSARPISKSWPAQRTFCPTGIKSAALK